MGVDSKRSRSGLAQSRRNAMHALERSGFSWSRLRALGTPGEDGVVSLDFTKADGLTARKAHGWGMVRRKP
jgi:hypothetical protein